MKKYCMYALIVVTGFSAMAAEAGSPPFNLKWGMTSVEAEAAVGEMERCTTNNYYRDETGAPGEFCYQEGAGALRNPAPPGIIKYEIALRFLKTCGLFRVIYTEWFETVGFKKTLPKIFNALGRAHNLPFDQRYVIEPDGPFAGSYHINTPEGDFSAYSHTRQHPEESTVVMLYRNNCAFEEFVPERE